MNAINDSHKRTSISQLLNPSHDQSSFSQHSSLEGAVGPPQHTQHEHHPGPPFQPQYDAGASFNLRAANWDHIQGDQHGLKRKPDGDQGHSLMRPRLDGQANYMDGTMWPAPHEVAAIPYSTPVLLPLYSDERTALSGDFPQHNQYPQQYQDQPTPTANPQSTGYFHSPIQNLASRETVQETSPQPQQWRPHPQFCTPGYMLPLAPTVSTQKRPTSAIENTEESVPKAKRAKSKSKQSTESNSAGTSKRGYTAKKRNEAALIAAQNAQLLPVVSYTQVPSENGKEKAGEGAQMVIVDPNSGGVHSETTGLHPELQFARCMSNRYRSEPFPRCVSCTRRWAGDTCRFQAIRFFLKDSQRNIVGVSFVENQKPDAPTMQFPVQWNVPLEPIHFRRTKRTIAHALLPVLKLESQHLCAQGIIVRPRESDVRATCDTCMTSLFSSSWMCRLCGREACAECFEQVKALTVNRPGASGQEIAQLQAKREKHAHTNPFFLSCTKRNEHQSKDFSPVSRFCRSELEEAIKDMEAVLAEPDVDALPLCDSTNPEASSYDPVVNGAFAQGVPVNGATSSEATAPLSLHGFVANLSSTSPSELVQVAHPVLNGNVSGITSDTSSSGLVGSTSVALTNDSMISWKPMSLSDGIDIPCHPTHHFSDAELTDDIFRPMWARGEPLIVHGILAKFKIKWTPEYFIEKYGTETCLIVECRTDQNKRVTVGEFFSWFEKYEGRQECWKLKDWPPTQDFKKSFPELYDDFAQAVPVPDYVRRDGALNIASHFPRNTVAPDLGPKMYNAMASSEGPGGKGSTRLHMDMADAVNIMTYASTAPDGSPGCAAWDLFRAEDSDKLRKFLRKRFQGVFQHDPIHSQQVYLDSTARKELLKDYGVKSHRVYQRPGEAVFIPAGCAHQVCNLADCIKVAVDFVSPENIARCEKLTREFREQNQSMVWKEDVLQLRTMMWFAWLSCRRQESTD